MAIIQESLVYQNPATVSGMSPPTQPAAPIMQPPDTTSPLPEESGSSLGRLIIKILIGLSIIVVIILVIIFVILPFFRKGQTAEETTLAYWGLWEDDRVMKTIIADFKRDNPKITVEYKKMDSKQYLERVLARSANGEGPDIYRYHNTWVPMLQKQALLLPLSTEAISPSEFRKIYYPVMQKDLIKNGAIYGIPLHIDTLALFANTKIFQAAGIAVPANWNEFVAAARGMTTTTEGGEIKTAGASIGSYTNITHAPDVISVLLLQSGADLSVLANTQENATSAIEFYTDFVNGNQAVWSSRLNESRKLFAEDKLAMYFGYSWDIFMIRALNKDLSFSVHEMPKLAGAEPLTMASYWVEGVSAKTKHPKEAMLFMHFLAQKETAQKLYAEEVKSGREFGELYARRDLAESLKTNELIYPFVQQAESAQSSFFASDTQDSEAGINSRMNKYLENAITSIIGDNHTSIATALETLTNGVAQVLQTYAQ